MSRLLVGVVVIALALVIPVIGIAGGPSGAKMPPLDPALMGFLEQGVWYFPCTAPEYRYRIAPRYQTYGPPPPPCCPVPCAPVPPPAKVK